MKRTIFGRFVLFPLVGIVALSCSSGESEAVIIDRIVAVVNEDIITLSQLKEITVPYLEKMKAKYSMEYNEEQVKETEMRILDQLIDEKLVDQEAKRLQIVITEKEVDLGIRDVRENNKLSDEQFKQVLEGEGMTFERYREELKNQMQKMRLLDQEIKSKIQVREEEVEEYYTQHTQDFNTPPEVKLQQILLMIPPQSTEQDISQLRQKAEGLLKRIKEGEDFSGLAALHSQDASAASGGTIGFFKRGELMPLLNDVAFSLPAGEVSQVIQTPQGFHIIKLLEKREREKMTKEELHKEIQGILYNQKLDEKFKQWLNDLRKKSYLSVNL